MKPFEIYFWNSLFWLFYLPISLVVYFWGGGGSVFGIVLVGLVCSIILSVILLFIDNLIWMTPKVSAPKSRVKLELLPMYLLESNNNLEVKKYEEEKFVSVEFEPKMRTDVDLDRLDCDDDCDYC